MLSIKLKWSAKCPKHPRFNPAIDGEAGIKGGCGLCHKLMDALVLGRAFEEKLDAISANLSNEGATNGNG